MGNKNVCRGRPLCLPADNGRPQGVAPTFAKVPSEIGNSWEPVISVRDLKTQFQKGLIVPLVKKISCERDPWELFLKIQTSPYSFFLDSVRPQARTAAFSYFGGDPFFVLKKKAKTIWLEDRNGTKKVSGDFLTVLRKLFSHYRGRSWKELPFFSGGAVGYFGYGLAWEFEKLPRLAKNDTHLDDAILLGIQNLFVFDHVHQVLYLISNLIPEKAFSFETALAKAEEWIEQAAGHINQRVFSTNGKISIRNFQADIGKRKFKHMVSRAKKYIEAGDIYQANLSQRFSFQFSGCPETLYQNLRSINPSPFASFLRLNDLIIVSASPERLVKKIGTHCEARPIAGTRPRGKTKEEMKKFREELKANIKERAEHIMLVDLARNDLGRVCEPHTVRVSEMMTCEEYSHVIHLVSNVEGKMRKDQDQFDLIKAMFPGGTITGCPKIRCMEIIESLEPFARSLYTGSIGYLGFNGDLDLNIIIRTIILNKNKGYFQVGAGIVYDSNPESEYWETMQKGEALVDALVTSSRR